MDAGRTNERMDEMRWGAREGGWGMSDVLVWCVMITLKGHALDIRRDAENAVYIFTRTTENT